MALPPPRDKDPEAYRGIVVFLTILFMVSGMFAISAGAIGIGCGVSSLGQLLWHHLYSKTAPRFMVWLNGISMGVNLVLMAFIFAVVHHL
jgi:hypothetical protein